MSDRRPSTSSRPCRSSRARGDRPRRARRVLRPRTVRRASSSGARATRPGDGLHRRGAVSASMQRAGLLRGRDRAGGPRRMVGEIALLDGGRHTISCARPSHDGARAEPADFAALLSRAASVGVRLKRRLAALPAPARPARGLAPRSAAGAAGRRRRSPSSSCGPPDSGTCAAWRPSATSTRSALWGILTSVLRACPPGRTLLAEGAPSSACYLTLNGAVEKVMVRGGRRIRVGLAGPGKGSATRASSTAARRP